MENNELESFFACEGVDERLSELVTHSFWVRWRLKVKLGGESQESEREITRERKNGREFEFLLG
jgi:hypothetical protein